MITGEPGWELFARYAFPPNELGYCGPADASVLLRGGERTAVAEHAAGFDGAWPYLQEIAASTGSADPLDAAVVRTYWIGGPQLAAVDDARLARRLRKEFARQPTGVLNTVGAVLAHHSFHVFAVYPWVRFLDIDASTPLRILQACRIRWGTVQRVDGDHVVMTSPPLRFTDGTLTLGEAATESVRWSRDGTSLAPAPRPGDTVAAHWDWVCGPLDDDEATALEEATVTTLDVVNAARQTEPSPLFAR
ncbi:MAG: DUF6390 family protein [Mycobacterium sp.]